MCGCVPNISHHLHDRYLKRLIAHNVIHTGQQILRLRHNLAGTLNHFVHAHLFQARHIIAVLQKTGIGLPRRNVDKLIAHNSGRTDGHLRAFGDLHPFIDLHGHSNTFAIILHR